MKPSMHLPLLALAPAVSLGALVPGDVAERGRDLGETILSGLREHSSAIDRVLGSELAQGLEQNLDSAIDLLDDDDDDDAEPTLTIYQLISECPHTTKFAAHLSEHDDLVKLLNSTDAQHTLFVPTDEAFDHLPFKERPSDEWIRAALEYHITTGARTAHDLVRTETVPTVLKEDWLGGRPQRLRASLNLKGLHINFLSKIVKPNTRATNGIIHAVNRVFITPTMAGREISLLPNVFSTLLLAYDKTDFVKFIHHVPMEGSTVFAPTNRAFARLGPAANAFLFNTDKGKTILKALLKYQIVANVTLYSDEVYDSTGETEGMGGQRHLHYDLVTLLQEKHVSVDVDYFGPFVSLKVNGEAPVVVRDVVAKNGVIQVVGKVPLPPHKHHDGDKGDEEVAVESLVERLWDYVDEEDRAGWSNEL